MSLQLEVLQRLLLSSQVFLHYYDDDHDHVDHVDEAISNQLPCTTLSFSTWIHPTISFHEMS